MKQKHIFLVFHNFGLGGVQRRMVDIANFISRSDDYKDFICHILLREKADFSFDKYLDKNAKRIKVHYAPQLPSIPLVWRFKNISYGLFLIAKIYIYKPVGILTFLHFSLPFLILAKTALFWIKFNLVLSQDNILSFYNQSQHVTRVFHKRIIGFLYHFCSRIIVQTTFAKKDLIDNFYIPSRKIKVIQNWVVGDLSIYGNQKRLYDFIYCGRFARQKNLYLMIVMMSLITKLDPNLSLLMIGEGERELYLKRLVKKLGLEKNIFFLSPTHRVYDYLSKAKIFLLTSEFEGHPMILLEAMALGVVPLVMRYPGVSEYIKHGQTGFVELGQKEMVRCGLELVGNKRLLQRISKNAELVVKKENGEELINQTLQLLY